MSALSSGAVVSLVSAIEATAGTLPTTGWRTNQPNDQGIKAFFNKYKKVARQPLSPNMMEEKGDIVDLDFNPEIISDLNKEIIDSFGPGALLTTEKWNGGTGTGRFAVTTTCTGAVALSAVTSSQFTVASGGALAAGVLIYSRGFAAAANNGLLVVQAASTATAIKTTGTVADGAPAANAMVEVVGVQGAASDITATTTGLASTALDFTTLGLQQYQWIWVGGGTKAAPGALGFTGAGYRGFARINTIAAHALTLDRTLTAQATDTGTGQTIQIFFGSWLRNVAKTAGDRAETTHSLELGVPGLDTGAAEDFFYGTGCIVDKLVIDGPAQNKCLATISFKGFNTTSPSTSRQAGASAAPTPLAEAAFNTATELPRLRIVNQASGAVNCIDIDTWKLTINNQVHAQKEQGTLGPLRMLPGILNVTVDITAFLLQPDLINSISANTSLAAEGCLRNNDGGIVWDIPFATFEDGEPNFPLTKAITIKGVLKGYRDPTSNIVMGITKFPFLPAN